MQHKIIVHVSYKNSSGYIELVNSTPNCEVDVGQNELNWGVVYSPWNVSLKTNLYVASVKCNPSQLTYVSGWSHMVADADPHSANEL